MIRLLAISIALLAAAGCAASPRASAVTVADVHGAVHHPLAAGGGESDLAVLVFITVDCPIANAYAPEVNRIVDGFADRGVSFYLVHVDRAFAAADARRHAREYGFTCPVLVDANHRLVAEIGATVTPEAALVRRRPAAEPDAPFELIYRGRIDDRYVDFGRRRVAPSRHDLRDAIDAALRGEPVGESRTKAIGCFIPGVS